MLIVKDLSKSFGRIEVLHKLSFSLPSGEITALLGPNGAGKTTLMRSIIGYYDTFSGQVSYGDTDLADSRSAFAAHIAYVPESGGLYPEMTVAEYLRFMADLKHLSSSEFALRSDMLAAALELNSVLMQKCETLSKGYSRRTAIAGALIGHPDVLILDEPCEGLDLQQKINLRAFLKDYGRSCAILLSTHIMEDVEALAQRVLLINKGELVCDSPLADFKRRFQSNNIEDAFCAVIKQLG
ncbi:MAG: ABC transporter ATP-binding protein [Alphaproteobacteria bacterium]|nr:ABC transporter ATP-binding protein [Alphaproteobacteria bacterium]